MHVTCRLPDTVRVDAEGRALRKRLGRGGAHKALRHEKNITSAHFRARGGCRALADGALHLKLRVLGHFFANADLLSFHGCKVLYHLHKRDREREREGAFRSRLKNIQ